MRRRGPWALLALIAGFVAGGIALGLIRLVPVPPAHRPPPAPLPAPPRTPPAPLPVAVEPAPEPPEPAPVEVVAPEPTPRVRPPVEWARFELPSATEIVATCGGAVARGVDRAKLTGFAPGVCTVSAVVDGQPLATDVVVDGAGPVPCRTGGPDGLTCAR